MLPAHVFASMSEQQHTELFTALHGPWRNATRIMMVVLSAGRDVRRAGCPPGGMSAGRDVRRAGCPPGGMSAGRDRRPAALRPETVRAWIARHHTEGLAGLADRSRSGRPHKGSRRLGERIHALPQTPRSWTTARIWKALGRPRLSMSTMRARIKE